MLGAIVAITITLPRAPNSPAYLVQNPTSFPLCSHSTGSPLPRGPSQFPSVTCSSVLPDSSGCIPTSQTESRTRGTRLVRRLEGSWSQFLQNLTEEGKRLGWGISNQQIIPSLTGHKESMFHRLHWGGICWGGIFKCLLCVGHMLSL